MDPERRERRLPRREEPWKGLPCECGSRSLGKTGHAVPTGGDNMVRGETMNPDY